MCAPKARILALLTTTRPRKPDICGSGDRAGSELCELNDVTLTVDMLPAERVYLSLWQPRW
jgi:hypothetical protein